MESKPNSSTASKYLWALALIIYGAALSFRITEFPIYFFCDEAFHALVGEELISRGLRRADGYFLPIYFEAAPLRWTPALPVYIQGLAALLFGKSVETIRLTSVAITVLGVGAISLFVKEVLNSRLWWATPLVFAAIPAWYLHARTGFETIIMSAFILTGMAAYGYYQKRGGFYLVIATLFFCFAFYTYSNGQLTIPVLIGLLFLSDIDLHIKRPRSLLIAFIVALICAIPAFVFMYKHGNKQAEHLSTIGSPLFKEHDSIVMLTKIAQEYLSGLNPLYWFNNTSVDMKRHLVMERPHLPLWFIPFALVGLIRCLFRLKDRGVRALFVLAIATPCAAALAQTSITRVLTIAAVYAMFVVIGLEVFTERIKNSKIVTGLLFVGLTFAALELSYTALVRAPGAADGYGLHGMQWGAKQIFADLVPRLIKQYPGVQISVTSTWANGTDRFPRFFLTPEQQARVRIHNPELKRYQELDQKEIFILDFGVFREVIESGKFQPPEILETLYYPDGSEAFRAVRLKYSSNAKELYKKEYLELITPISEDTEINGIKVSLEHSPFDMGGIIHILDNDPLTLARGAESNPIVMNFKFEKSQQVKAINATLAENFLHAIIECVNEAGKVIATIDEKYNAQTDEKRTLYFKDGVKTCKEVRTSFQNVMIPKGSNANIHVREISLE